MSNSATSVAFFLLASSSLSPSSASAATPPRLSLRNILRETTAPSPHRGLDLHRTLRDSNGAVRIAWDIDDADLAFGADLGGEGGESSFRLAHARGSALGHLCECSIFRSNDDDDDEGGSDPFRRHPGDLRKIVLPDGSVRRTLATATVGHGVDANGDGAGAASAHPLALPEWISDECGPDALESFESLRDAVAYVANAFVKALDAEKAGGAADASVSMSTAPGPGQMMTERGTEGERLRGGGGGAKEEVADASSYAASSTPSSGKSYRKMLSSANHLEHFHVYSKPPKAPSRHRSGEDADVASLDYHTDAGFFLAFVPAMDCRTRNLDDNSFHLKGGIAGTGGGKGGPAAFREDEVVIMMGTGAQYWLDMNEPSDGQSNNTLSDDDKENDFSFLAAPHALHLSPGAHRSWFGKMHLLPASTPLTPSGVTTFGDLPYRLGNDGHAYVPPTSADGCGGSTELHLDVATEEEEGERSRRTESSFLASPLVSTRHLIGSRRIQHVNSPQDCNNSTDFFCWYQCVPIPQSNRIESYLREDYSLYCLDPATLANSGNSVGKAAAPCKEGYVHNPDCMGSWQPTAPGVPAYPLPSFEDGSFNDASGDDFCHGGTSMYMDGFNWLGSTCVIFLFPSWILSSSGKLIGACLGTIVFGVFLEYVLWKRRAVALMEPGNARLMLSSIVYGLQLSLGYFVMLVIMTYSGPLFLSTVLGLMIGHAVFNSQDSYMRRREERLRITKIAAVAIPSSCCAPTLDGEGSGNGGNGSGGGDDGREFENEVSCCEGGVKEKKDVSSSEKQRKYNFPEGATPCCQYEL